MKITYDSLVICDVNLQMHLFNERSLSTEDKLKELRDGQKKYGWRCYEQI